MHLTYRNVNDAFDGLVGLFSDPPPGIGKEIVTVSTRNGDCLMVPEPVTITYEKPLERVLFNKARDANPFFHVFESLWMLSGSNKLAPLQKYVSNFGDFSDDGDELNGAYGYRWRWANYRESLHEFIPIDDSEDPECAGGWLYLDQLKILIKHLKENPTSRRAVLQMWNVEDDLLKIDSSKDVCCNTAVYFSIREMDPVPITEPGSTQPAYLDMTVTNRSNDLIWGTLGANVVHMSFLQEYMANCIGVEVGVYNQFSNNLHAYKERFEPEKWLDDKTLNVYTDDSVQPQRKTHVPLVSSQEVFDKEVKEFIEMDFVHGQEVCSRCGKVSEKGDDGLIVHTGQCNLEPTTPIKRKALQRVWEEPFLETVAKPLMLAFEAHKARDYDQAFGWLRFCEAGDWFLAGHHWLTIRENNWREKSA